MNVLLVTDLSIRQKDGRCYFNDAITITLKRYYDAFGKLVLCCRTKPCEDAAKLNDVTDLFERVVPINGFLSVFLGKRDGAIKEAVKDADLVVFRAPGVVIDRVGILARRLGKPYYVELMADAWEDCWWSRKQIGKLYAPYAFFMTKRLLKQASYGLYVTERFLQSRYPCPRKTVNASNVKIDRIDEGLLDKRLAKIEKGDLAHITLMTTANLDVPAKGQRYVIRAIPLLNKAGVRVTYKLVGGGSPDTLKREAQKYGVSDQVVFAGRKTLPEVLEELDSADVYVHPSFHEGLPRAVIEALSRACPAIGSRTGGTPELLPKNCVFARRSAKAVAETLLALLDKKTLKELAATGMETAKGYLNETVSARRNAYFDYVKRDFAQKGNEKEEDTL